VINILWQEFVKGGGIGKPLDDTLYGVGDSSLLCGAQKTQRSEVVAASLLTHRASHFSNPSRGIWREDPFIGGDSDTMVEVMTLIRCGLTCRDIELGHHTQGCVGASGVE